MSEPQAPASVGGYRWVVCGLLFAATTINYMDRQILGVLAGTLQGQLHWTETDYAHIVIAFQAAYALGTLVLGYFIDRWGTRIGYSVAIVGWSIAAAAHAAARTVFQFALCRFALGIGESGNFPAAIRAVADWFPRRERALATGLFNSGSSLGPIIAPWLVEKLTHLYGWHVAFITLGAAGLVWGVAWWFLYDSPEQSKMLSPAELEYIRSDKPIGEPEPAQSISWRRLFGMRQAWAYVIPSAMISPVWWFYLYWLPKFLQQQFGLRLDQLSKPLAVGYAIAVVGSFAGGWISSALIRAGKPAGMARKTAMLICATAVVPVAFITQMQSLTLASIVAGLAMAGHQGMSANLYTMSSDLFPRRAVASVVGMATAFGGVVAIAFSEIVGTVLSHFHSYSFPFIVAGIGYPLAVLCVHLLSPDWVPAQTKRRR